MTRAYSLALSLVLTLAPMIGATAPLSLHQPIPSDPRCSVSDAAEVEACISIAFDPERSTDWLAALDTCAMRAPACRETVLDWHLTYSCVLPRRYELVAAGPAPLSVGASRVVSSVDDLPAREQAQLIEAVAYATGTEIDSAAEALAATDSRRANVSLFWDNSGDRVLVALEFEQNGRSQGAFYEFGSTFPLARIHDGAIVACVATWGSSPYLSIR